MVGTRTVRWPSVKDASCSNQRTPASPRLSVSAMMWACETGDEIPGTEKVAYLDLVLQCLLRKRTDLASQNILLFVVELH